MRTIVTVVIFGGTLWGQAPALPSRFDLTPPEPAIRKPAQPTHFLEAVGRRGAILGAEDGTFEAWLNPIKLVRDFRLSVFFDGSLEPVDLADLAETAAVSPGRVTITHSHAAFTIRQTWVAAIDQPVLLALLEIDTNRPLKLRASFIPEMKPMWPASFGGQSSSWDGQERAFVLSEGLRRYAPVIGSPLFSTHSEQVGHQLPGRRIAVDMEVTPEISRGHVIPIVLAASRQSYRAALADVERVVAESDAYYKAFEARTLAVATPDATLNGAARWAKFALEKGWACNEGVGCGLVAGYARSGESERPGFAWYFGGDALMNSWSVVDYGDFERARGILTFLREHQRADGKMEHELTQSAALLDWSQYPYGYYHADTTPLYIFSVWRYVARSGDLEFLRQLWPSIEKAYAYCLGVLDDDGLLSNRKAGAGAVETGALSGKVANDIYLQGVWLAALDAFAKMAEAAGKPAQDAAARRDRARQALNEWFVESKGTFAFARLTDGSMYEAQSAWQGPALAFGGLDATKAARAAARLARAELTTDWGARLFATDSPNYDPLSYNDGSVWPFVTGFVTVAEYANHQAAGGLRHLYGTAAMTGLAAAGFIPEYMSGERAQALPHAVPHQLFSSSAVIDPLVGGMLGLEGDALLRTLSVRPHIPQGWTVRFERYRVGGSMVSGEIRRERGSARVALTISGEPLAVTFSPAMAAGAKAAGAEWNGSRVEAQMEATAGDVHITVRGAAAQRVEARIAAEEAAEAMP
ncbi:MAG TPA: GH116 family glycosyl hydrolase, partial [Candidatus Sulfopaludibacter sp.]|nr:GH116 family glycosyl hydrolase [Candidatus Sulfopaludibacter sp.]